MRDGRMVAKSLLFLMALSLFALGLKMGADDVEALRRLITVSIFGV